MSSKPAVLVIGDTHCPGMLSSYVKFLITVTEKYGCTKVIHIGDLIDFNCLSYHEKNPDLPSVADEIDEARKQVRSLTDAFPRVEMLTGNHDALLERKAITAGISSSLVKPLKDVFSLPSGWHIHPRYTKLFHNNVLYQHGDSGKGGQQAAYKNALAEHVSVVQGHFHSQSGVWFYANERNRVFGAQTGCGIDHEKLQFAYGVKFNAKPIVSCLVILDKGRLPIVEVMSL